MRPYNIVTSMNSFCMDFKVELLSPVISVAKLYQLGLVSFLIYVAL